MELSRMMKGRPLTSSREAPAEKGVGWTIRFKGYLPVDDRMEDRLRRVVAEIDRVPDSALEIDEAERVITVDYGEVRGWLEESRRLLRAVRAGARIVVKPPWEDYRRQPGDVVLEIEPGSSFGSGLHETTSLCLEALERHVRPGAAVVDFGTGSGVLAICAARLGASRVAAIEADAESSDVARENVLGNRLASVVQVIFADDLSAVEWQADLVSANIVPGTIVSHLAEFARVLKRGGLLIASGMNEKNASEVEHALPGEGFATVEAIKDVVTLKFGKLRSGFRLSMSGRQLGNALKDVGLLQEGANLDNAAITIEFTA